MVCFAKPKVTYEERAHTWAAASRFAIILGWALELWARRGPDVSAPVCEGTLYLRSYVLCLRFSSHPMAGCMFFRISMEGIPRLERVGRVGLFTSEECQFIDDLTVLFLDLGKRLGAETEGAITQFFKGGVRPELPRVFEPFIEEVMKSKISIVELIGV